MTVIESEECYAPHELGYSYFGSGTYWFGKYFPTEPVVPGYKLHVAPQLADAEVVARSVLPVLRRLRVPHKVVRSQARYEEQWATAQRGKFITVYTGDALAAAVAVVQAIEVELIGLRQYGGIRPGEPPRVPGTDDREQAVGASGLVFMRWADSDAD